MRVDATDVQAQVSIFTDLPGTGNSTLAEQVARRCAPAFAADWLMGALKPALARFDRSEYLAARSRLLETLVTRQLMLGQDAVVDALVSDSQVADGTIPPLGSLPARMPVPADAENPSHDPVRHRSYTPASALTFSHGTDSPGSASASRAAAASARSSGNSRVSCPLMPSSASANSAGTSIVALRDAGKHPCSRGVKTAG